MWTVRRVCTNCNSLFTAPDNSMRQLCGRCIKYSQLSGVTKKLPTKRDTYLLRTYNITGAQYNAMLKAQNGVCAICDRPPKPGTRLHVDHHHAALNVRGLLCTGCNTRLGWLEKHSTGIARYLKGMPR